MARSPHGGRAIFEDFEFMARLSAVESNLGQTVADGSEFGDDLESLSDSELLERIHRLRMSAADAYKQVGHDALERWVHLSERYAIEARRRGSDFQLSSGKENGERVTVVPIKILTNLP